MSDDPIARLLDRQVLDRQALDALVNSLPDGITVADDAAGRHDFLNANRALMQAERHLAGDPSQNPSQLTQLDQQALIDLLKNNAIHSINNVPFNQADYDTIDQLHQALLNAEDINIHGGNLLEKTNDIGALLEGLENNGTTPLEPVQGAVNMQRYLDGLGTPYEVMEIGTQPQLEERASAVVEANEVELAQVPDVRSAGSGPAIG